MAPVLKRFTISETGSTSSSGTGVRPASVEVEQVAQGDGTAGAVDDLAILAEEVHVALGAGALQEIDRTRLDEVLLAVDRTPLREAQARELVRRRALRKGHRRGVALVLLTLDALDVEAAHARRGAREVAVDETVRKADRSRISARSGSPASSRCPSWT